MPAGRPTLLTPELVAQAEVLANDGLPLDMIADAIGVAPRTCQDWLKAAREGDSSDLKQQFLRVISTAHRNWAKSLVGSVRKSADDGNSWAATWILTHHPALRDHFSDAAAERRTERRTMATVLDAVAAVGLSPEQEQTLILQMQARGLGAEKPEG